MKPTSDPVAAPHYRRAGRPGVTQAQVDRTADALLQQGKRPSIEQVRSELGGSPNTLAPLLEDWWRRLAARVRVGPGAFERLPGSLAQIAEAFFLHALEEARQTVRQEERRERDDLVREQQAVQVRSHVLTLREQELQARLTERERTVQALEAQLQDLGLLLRKMQNARDAAERRLDTLNAERALAQRRPAKPVRARKTKAVKRKAARPKPKKTRSRRR